MIIGACWFLAGAGLNAGEWGRVGMSASLQGPRHDPDQRWHCAFVNQFTCP